MLQPSAQSENSGIDALNRWLLAHERWLRWAIFLAAAAAALLSEARRHFVPLISDEWAYFFQADTFARGHLSLPAPALPEFFEAPGLLISPVYASKYFPGHALLLAPFVALHAAWLWPCLSLGASAACLYQLARATRLQPLGAALAASILFLSPPAVDVLSGWLSHTSTTLLLLGALAIVLSQPERSRSFLLAGILLGLTALARPLNALPLGLALGSIALKVGTPNHRTRLVRLTALALPAAASMTCLLIYNHLITGDFRLTPWALWARQYTPTDGMGVGAPAPVAALREIPPQLQFLVKLYSDSRASYSWSRLLADAFSRLRIWLEFVPSPFFVPLLAFGVFSIRSRKRALWLWLPSVLLFLLLLGFHARLPQYLSELVPALGLAVGIGAERLLSIWCGASERPRTAMLATALFAALVLLDEIFFGDIEPLPLALLVLSLLTALVCAGSSLGRSPPFARALLAASLAIFFVFGALDVRRTRQLLWSRTDLTPCKPGPRFTERCEVEAELRFEQINEQVSALHGILFVAPARADQGLPLSNPGLGISDPPLVRATDLGPRNAELRKLFPGRRAFLVSENLELRELDPIDPKPHN